MSALNRGSEALLSIGDPPAQYDQIYMSQLASVLNGLLQSLGKGIDLNVNNLKFNSAPDSTSGLRIGSVYLKTLTSGEKVLSIVLPGDSF